MTTYLTRVMSAIKEPKIPKYWLGYFRENFRGEINDQLQEAFHTGGATKSEIARKLHRRPEQITRWLSAPCNLEADTISDIALALGLTPKIRFEKVGEYRSNEKVHTFIERYDQSMATGETEARTFVVDQFSYDVRPSASTSQPKTISAPISNKARMKELVSHA